MSVLHAPEIIERLSNAEDGVEAVISRHAKGYAVALKDLDSGDCLNTIKIFPTLEKARLYAWEIAAVC